MKTNSLLTEQVITAAGKKPGKEKYAPPKNRKLPCYSPVLCRQPGFLYLAAMAAAIKNIIFDLGGVLLDIDYYRPVKEFAALGLGGFEEMYSQAAANPLFEQLETGKISNSSFLDAIAALAPQPLTHLQVTAAWNSIILHFRQQSMIFLETLRQQYKIYLLSNTNNIHLEQIQKILQQDTGKQNLDGYFTKAWYSSKLGLRKPEKDIYEFVLRDGGLTAAETLFIDDSAQNIETAAVLGIKTHLLQPSEAIETLHWFT